MPGTQRPLVYVARGSHAAYFEPGRHWTGHWFDYADAKRRSPELSLNIVVEDDEDWRWVRWPGSLGRHEEGRQPARLRQSRTGPAARDQWDDPLVMVREGRRAARATAGASGRGRRPRRSCASSGPAAPIRVTLHGPARDPTAGIPRGLAVTINSPEETAPPTTETFTISTRSRQRRPDHAGRSGQVLRRLRQLRDGGRPGVAERARRSRLRYLTAPGQLWPDGQRIARRFVHRAKDAPGRRRHALLA